MSSGFYHLYFIKDVATPLQNLAFDAVTSYENLRPVWIDGEDAVEKFKDSSPNNCCFVLGKFSGSVYEHFRALGSSVFGPQVLLDYLREERPLPNVSHPLFSTALRNANVTVTSITGQQRERLFSSIEMLHGVASRNLTDEVNVIVAPKVGSKKYIVGASRGLHILTPEWIDEAWKLSETVDPIDMLQHNLMSKFKLPIFAQLVICVSGLTVEERKEVAEIVKNNGGQYSGEMKIGLTTHLLVKRAGGVKYNFAKKWKVRVVSVHWLSDSVSKGYALDETDYYIKEEGGHRQKCHSSTPTSSISVNDPSVLGDLSAITDPNHAKLDETHFSCLKDLTNSTRLSKSPEHSFLTGCVIFLYGCDSSESAKLAEMIKIGGGILCADASEKVTESVTHVVFGSDSKPISPSDLESEVFYVTHNWLEQCHEQHKRLAEKEFKPPFLSKTEPSDQNIDDNKPSGVPVDTEEIQLINQYFKDGGLADMDDFLSIENNPEDQTFQGDAEETKLVTLKQPEPEVQEEVTLSDSGLFSHLIFKPDINFSLTAHPALSEVITDEGGSVINDSSVAADYIICSYVLRQPATSNMITPYWINCCVTAKTLLISELDTQVGFRPIHIPPSVTLPLDGCVISLSGFVGNDRVFLTDLARGLGAVVQECFLRKPVPSRNLIASTHLVAARPDGRKWPASKQWGLPAVSCSWLYACATTGRRAAEMEHPVMEEDPLVPQDWSQVIQRSSLAFNVTPKSTRRSDGGGQLKTPGWVGAGDQMRTPSSGSLEVLHVSPPMSEQVTRCLKTALAKTSMLPKRNLAETDFKEAAQSGRVLKGVVICVAKSLSDRQVALNELVKQLGGDFRWNFDVKVCTHMIASPSTCLLPAASPMLRGAASASQPPQTLLDPDVRSALEESHVKVVVPQWLYDCQRLGKHLPEADYAFSIDSAATVSPKQSTLKASAATDVVDEAQSSSILDDVARRLESVMGSKAQPFSEDPHPDRRDVSLAVRRSHRTRRRHMPTCGSGVDGFGLSSSTAPSSNFVRWQYEDSPEVRNGLPSPHVVKSQSSRESTQPGENVSPEKTTLKPQPQSSTNTTRVRIFSVSGVNQDEKVRYQAIITELGADLDPGMTVGETTTHLIINSPSRCEKYLMCMAGGRWILHKSYLDACAAASVWLPEEAYEWGGPGTEPLLIQLSPASNRSGPTGGLSCGQLRDLAKAARHWRKTGGGAFKGWRVVFGPGCDRENSFKRIIEFGGGMVLANGAPYPPAEQVTHAFTKRRSGSSRSSGPQPELPIIEGYEWLRVEFLCAHLTGMGSASRSEFLVKQTSDEMTIPTAKRSRVTR
ncbi:DNA topoisomerase 2-binding protein 1 [Echinococcus granulosus]|uniref:DNA topoisomerase 2 binding protein 1 n=1 Tax=Echinococcus granulosus TaxID=6210 RepID=A0A068WFX6_ECHGR|nr:DNA topoisomerase 2-binding protein 1 [Echinococcus granulosus]CDS16564.1 DNA topoisomerase 2 binding protein 1 [Echinococcus granulosus]